VLREPVRLAPRHVVAVAWRSVVLLAVVDVVLALGAAALSDLIWLAVVMIGLPVVGVVAFVVGVPAGLLLARALRGRRALVHVLAFALAGGALGAGAMRVVLLSVPDATPWVVGAFLQGTVGAGVACWWTIWRVDHPRLARVPRYVPDALVEDLAVDRQLGLAPPAARDETG